MKFKNLLVLCAMDEEFAAVKKQIHSYYKESILVNQKTETYVEKYSSDTRNIYLTKSGIGSVNSALNVFQVCNELLIDGVVLLGVGGALKTEMEIGDLVVSSQIIQHDYYSSLDEGNFNVKPGEYILDARDADKFDPFFNCNKELIKACSEVKHQTKTYIKVIASGGEFVGTYLRKNAIADLNDNIYLVEMEAAGVAQVCQLLSMPFVVAKTVSDRLTLDHKIETDFLTFLHFAAKNSSLVAEHLLLV